MRHPENRSSATNARAGNDTPCRVAAALSSAGFECTIEMVDGVALVTASPAAIDRLGEPAFRSTIVAAARASGALRIAVTLGDA